MSGPHRLRKYFYDLPIRKKLLASYIAFISLPLILFFAITFIFVTHYYEDQVFFSARQSFDQAFTFIASKIDATVKASDVLYFNSDVQRALTRDSSGFRDNVIQQNIDMRSLDTVLSSFKDDDVYRVVLYVPEWLFYANQEINYSNLGKLRADPIHGRFFSSREKSVWFPAESVIDDANYSLSVRIIPMYRKIRDIENLERTVGVIKICIRESVIVNIIDKAKTTRGGIVYLRNSLGEQVCAGTGPRESISAIDRVFNAGTEESGQKSILVDGARYSLVTGNIPGTDWTLVSAIPFAEIRYQIERLSLVMLALILFLGSLAYCCAVLMTRSATGRLSLLSEAMDRVRNNDFGVRLDPVAGDEIGRLAMSFNYMSERISILLESQYRAGQALKSAELRALQAQIDPHFLSNTLELINWKALKSGVPEIAELSRALARFYSLTLNGGRNVVSINDELFHVETYVRIQNIRFGNRIVLNVKVPKAIRRLGILKLLLQPLVENSITHGILERGEDSGGRIGITARQEGPDVLIDIRDNGVGMTDGQIASLFLCANADTAHGYGVRNINERLKLHYGDAYGLLFRRNARAGITVSVRIPATELPEA